jgi:hypothetical protein
VALVIAYALFLRHMLTAWSLGAARLYSLKILYVAATLNICNTLWSTEAGGSKGWWWASDSAMTKIFEVLAVWQRVYCSAAKNDDKCRLSLYLICTSYNRTREQSP